MKLVENVANAICPDDILEWLMVKDIVDHLYNILFFRQAEIGLVEVTKKEALESILSSLGSGSKAEASKLAKDYFTDKKAYDGIGRLLSEFNMNPGHIDAEAVRLRSGELEKIERMIASRESRLRQAHRDIEFYRESRRFHEELKSKSRPNELPFIQSSELSDHKQDPAQDGLVKQPSGNEQESNEGNSESISMSRSQASSKLGSGDGNIQS